MAKPGAHSEGRWAPKILDGIKNMPDDVREAMKRALNGTKHRHFSTMNSDVQSKIRKSMRDPRDPQHGPDPAYVREAFNNLLIAASSEKGLHAVAAIYDQKAAERPASSVRLRRPYKYGQS